jgi:flagellar biogenesis protein FliO
VGVAVVDLFDSEMVIGFVKVVVILACLIPIMYFVTRWYAKAHKAHSTVHIRERVPLGGNRFLYVVEWAENRYLLALGGQQITIIDKQGVAVFQTGDQGLSSVQGEGGE